MIFQAAPTLRNMRRDLDDDVRPVIRLCFKFECSDCFIDGPQVPAIPYLFSRFFSLLRWFAGFFFLQQSNPVYQRLFIPVPGFKYFYLSVPEVTSRSRLWLLHAFRRFAAFLSADMLPSIFVYGSPRLPCDSGSGLCTNFGNRWICF